jgi:hypothetical protein
MRALHYAECFLKYKPGSKKMKEVDLLLEVYGEIHAWMEAQEAYNKSKKASKERPVVPVEAIYKLRGKLGKDVRKSFVDGRAIKYTMDWKWRKVR